MNRSVSTNLQTCILVFGNRFSTVRTYVSMSIFLFSSKNYEYLSVPHPFRYGTVRYGSKKITSNVFIVFNYRTGTYVRTVRKFHVFIFFKKLGIPYRTVRYGTGTFLLKIKILYVRMIERYYN